MINLFRKVLFNLKDLWSGTDNLPLSDQQKFSIDLLNKGLSRSFFVAVIILILQIINLIISCTTDDALIYVLLLDCGKTWMIVIAISYLLLYIITDKFIRKGRDQLKILLYLFWFLVMIGSLPFTYIELAQRHALTNYTVVILALAFIPLFNLKEILFYTTIYFGVHLILVCQMDVPPFIYQEMTILAGLTCYAAALQHRSLLQTFISQQKLLAMNDQLNVIANTDQLTNLLNRRGLEEHLQNNEEHHFGYYSMILIDIDLFKLYNDTYFHQAGDHCLQQVAESIKKAVINITDIISRHGGEEFLILADNLDETQLIALASKIRNAVYDLRIKMNDEPESPYLSISSGLCQKKLAPGMAVDNELVSEMFCEADQQLYLAKSHGRNCIYFNNKIYY